MVSRKVEAVSLQVEVELALVAEARLQVGFALVVVVAPADQGWAQVEWAAGLEMGMTLLPEVPQVALGFAVGLD